VYASPKVHSAFEDIAENTPCTDPYYFQQVSEFARTYVADQIRYIRSQFSASTSPYRESVLRELLEIENQIPKMRYPFED
jgi:hypothetical protein